MRVLISGASGLVGRALIPALEREGYDIVSLVRRPVQKNREIFWDPQTAKLDVSLLEGFDVWIHLAGENIAKGRWTLKRKAAIADSRIQGTKLLAHALSCLKKPPAVVLSASAIGYYGDTGETLVTEMSSGGDGFLATTCAQWEAPWAPITTTRVVLARIGLVLAKEGGALGAMLPVFKAGLGGPLGQGTQYVSWISLHDLVSAFLFLIRNPLAGPVNLVAPQPVTNNEFTKELAHILRRPAFMRVPAWGLGLLLGEMAQVLLLSGCRVMPKKLLEAGFRFDDPQLGMALKRSLGTV